MIVTTRRLSCYSDHRNTENKRGLGAHRMRMAALMKKATRRESVLSQVPYRTAIFLPRAVRGYARVWMMLECRYRLCGITVAPADRRHPDQSY